MKDNQDHLNVLRKINLNQNFHKEKLAKELGFSLGKLNYCIKELKKKGFIKIKNFRKQKDKIKYFQYIITPKGISERTKLTINFMRRKMQEYDDLKSEMENLNILNLKNKNKD